MAALGTPPARKGGRPAAQTAAPADKGRVLRHRPRVETLFTVFLILNLVAAAGAIISLEWAQSRIEINQVRSGGYQATVAGLRALGVRGNSRLAVNLQKARAGLAAAQAGVPATFASLNTVDYLFQVARATGASLQGVGVGATTLTGGLFVTPVQAQVSAPSVTVLLAFVRALNRGYPLATVQLGSLDFSPGPKNVSLTVQFYTRGGV